MWADEHQHLESIIIYCHDHTWNASWLAPVTPEAIIGAVNIYLGSDLKAVSYGFIILVEIKFCLLDQYGLWKGRKKNSVKL